MENNIFPAPQLGKPAKRDAGVPKENGVAPAPRKLGSPISVAEPRGVWPRWLGLFLGRVAPRFCRTEKKDCQSETCYFYNLCKCALKDDAAAAATETRVWVALACCGLAVVLYWLFGGLSR